ncbi:MAG: ethanolamine ammonia-lyase subunit EutB [Planctomycetales bacterium]|nr:ethanolamine ammonia-lyase subunit EutB [Planctomycetales bacterium]
MAAAHVAGVAALMLSANPSYTPEMVEGKLCEFATRDAGVAFEPWIHVNDVAGFIGPEVFRSREQLVRCCLEDIAMGKLHGLTIGLDVCSTLHMDVDLDDLDWCLDQIMPANPAYLMALPTKNDPMLSYLTTSFHDHVRIRKKFGYRADDRMWQFYQALGVIDAAGEPTVHFGEPQWVYLQYQRRKGDARSDEAILAEGRDQMEKVRSRGVFLAEGYGSESWSPPVELNDQVRSLYADAKRSLWKELPESFVSQQASAIELDSRARDRRDYILHPPSGETLASPSAARVARLAEEYAGRYDMQIVLSDGLNAWSLLDEGHLAPYLKSLYSALDEAGYQTAPYELVLRNGRVRAGYRIGETLFGGSSTPDKRCGVVHVIGERPGSGHHAFSAYLTLASARDWSRLGSIDHDATRVVSGIADSALLPEIAARETAKILRHWRS